MANPTTYHMPSVNSREAPRFREDASGFELFFDDVNEHATRAGISEQEAIKWALRYAGIEGEAWKYVECQTGNNAAAAQFQVFRDEVRHCYPNLSITRRYTNHDLAGLVQRTSELREMDREELGKYYRRFLPITSYLISEDRLSERERNTAYLKGLPHPIRIRVMHRLSIVKPDVVPGDGYEFADAHKAALFVTEAGSLEPTNPAATVVKSEPVEQGSIGDLIQAMSTLTRVFTANAQSQHSAPRPPRQPPSTPGGVAQNPPQWSQRIHPNSFTRNCAFCSATDHLIRECPSARQYIDQKRITRDHTGKIVLPDGNYIPHHITGRNLREKVDNFWLGKETQHPEPVNVHFLEGPEENVFAIEIGGPYSPPPSCIADSVSPSSIPATSWSLPEANPSSPTPYDEAVFQAELIQAQIDSLNDAKALALEKGKRYKFDGIELMKRSGPPKPGAPIPAPSGPTVHARGPLPARDNIPPLSTSPNVIGKPGTRAGDDRPQRPQGPMRPVAIPPKPAADDPKFRSQCPLESSVKPSDLADRVLDASVTVSARELLAASPEIRKQFKDLVTNKRVSANIVQAEEADAFLTGHLDSDSKAVPIDLGKYEQSSSTAVDSLPLRVIYPTFGPGVQPECVLDGGAQIVIMRKDIWERLNAPLSPDRAIPLQAANATTTMTCGQVRDLPVRLGPITVYLQIQVVENAPFEVLLGRPFFAVTNCSATSTPDGNHEIHVKDPRTGLPYVFSTHTRPRENPQKSSASYHSEPHGNFRL
jgi:hypothetical protein